MNEGIHLDLDTWIVPGQIRNDGVIINDNTFLLGRVLTPGERVLVLRCKQPTGLPDSVIVGPRHNAILLQAHCHRPHAIKMAFEGGPACP